MTSLNPDLGDSPREGATYHIRLSLRHLYDQTQMYKSGETPKTENPFLLLSPEHI